MKTASIKKILATILCSVMLATTFSINVLAATVTQNEQGITGCAVTPIAASDEGNAKKIAASPVTGIRVNSRGNGIDVNWSKLPGADGYYVYRYGSDKTWKNIAQLSGENTNSYHDDGIENGTKYMYKIRGYRNVSGRRYESALSKVLTIYGIRKNKISNIYSKSAGKMYVQWERNGYASGYEVKYVGNNKTQTVKVTGYANTSTYISALKGGVNYDVYVRTVMTVKGKEYYSSWSDKKSVTILRASENQVDPVDPVEPVDKKYSTLELNWKDSSVELVEDIYVYNSNGKDITGNLTYKGKKCYYNDKILFEFVEGTKKLTIKIYNTDMKYYFTFYDEGSGPIFAWPDIKSINHKYTDLSGYSTNGNYENQMGKAYTGSWFYCYTVDRDSITSEIFNQPAYYGVGTLGYIGGGAVYTTLYNETPIREASVNGIISKNKKSDITVTWNRLPNVNGYIVHRAKNNGDWARVSTIHSNTLKFVDTKVSNGAKYRYKVQGYVIAKGSTFVSALTNTCTTYRIARPNIETLNSKAAGKFFVKWTTNNAASGYEVKYVGNNRIAKDQAGAQNSISVVRLKGGAKYDVYVRSYKLVNGERIYSEWSSPKSVVVKKADY